MSSVIVDVFKWDPIDFWVDAVCRDDEHDMLFAIKSKVSSSSTIKYDRKLRCYLTEPVMLYRAAAVALGDQADGLLGGENMTVHLDDVVVVGAPESSQRAVPEANKQMPGSAATRPSRASTPWFHATPRPSREARPTRVDATLPRCNY